MEEELLKRWRLILGGDGAETILWKLYMIVTEEGGWVPRLPK